jgi:serine/threonine protein kinase
MGIMGDKDKSEDLFREFLSRRESGESVDPEEYLNRHPELKKELGMLFAEFMTKETGEEDQGQDSGPSAKSSEYPKIIGDFRIISELGRGGMGTVYEAEQISLNRKVALKVLPSHLSFSSEAVEKFQREAKAGGRQSHPGIVAIHAVGEHEGVHYIAQELVEGG